MARPENSETREQKLALKLRENLKRRKAQIKRRKAGQDENSNAGPTKSG